MRNPLFDERPIAVIWDFDKTLIAGSMQAPLFEKFDIEAKDFWDEADGLPEFYRGQGVKVSEDTLYLNHILSYVRAGRFPGLNNAMLRDLGGELTFYEGLPEFFATSKQEIEGNAVYGELGIGVEHYVVSTGLRQMIRGSAIDEFVEGIWACEFAERLASPGYLEGDDAGEDEAAGSGDVIQDIVYTINDTTKTRAIFEINKGINRDDRIDVNANIAPGDRRVPFENMIYIADGPSDVPVFSILRQYGGQTYAVYKSGHEDEFAQVAELSRQGRIDAFGEADYREGKQTSMWIRQAIRRAAERMVDTRRAERDDSISSRVGIAPGHLAD